MASESGSARAASADRSLNAAARVFFVLALGTGSAVLLSGCPNSTTSAKCSTRPDTPPGTAFIASCPPTPNMCAASSNRPASSVSSVSSTFS